MQQANCLPLSELAAVSTCQADDGQEQKRIENTFPQHFKLISRLSKRELEILKLLIEGHSNTEIAAILYLSPNTIKTHIRGILNKLSVDNRIQAAVAAVRMGLI